MKIKFLRLIIAVLLSYSFTLQGQALQFYREDIVFSLTNNNIETNAIYHFCNVGDKDIITPLFYPFPDNTIELLDSIIIKDALTDSVIHHRPGKSGIFFDISIKSYSQGSYRVFYRQRLTDNHFKYILSSTKSWGRALEFANFELLVPADMEIDSMSLPPDTSYLYQNVRYYLWKKKDFMPERDFEFWSKAIKF
jgi:hypothetical protein